MRAGHVQRGDLCRPGPPNPNPVLTLALTLTQVHCCDWASGIDADKGPAASWFSKYADDVVFQDYLGRMRARPAYLRAKQIQEDSPALA